MRATLMTLALLGIAACGGTPAPAGSDAAGMEGMDTGGMAGMPGMDQAGMPGMSGAGERLVVTSRQAALAGITFAVAREDSLARTLRAVAAVVPDERRVVVVNARVSGWVERLRANETGRRVAAGTPLLDLYSPELVTAQEELLLARRLPAAAGGDSLAAAARRRLALWSVPEAEITALEREGRGRRTLTLTSPAAGHVLEKHVIEGQMVRAGEMLYRIADLSTVWIEPALFERDVASVRVGQPVEVTVDALPGQVFRGRVTFIHPQLDARTRTLPVRVEVANPQGDLKPGMYATVRIAAAGAPGVVVPLTAVLPTGERNLSFVLRDGGIAPVEVVIGARGDTTLTVLRGLSLGDTVVASATFLLDSESSLAAAMKGIMLNMGMGLDMGGMKMEGDMPGMPGMRDTTRRPERRP